MEDSKRCDARAVIVWEAGKSLRGSSRTAFLAFHHYSESEIKRLPRSKIRQEETRIRFGGRICISGVTTDGRLPWINPTAANGFILSSIRKVGAALIAKQVYSRSTRLSGGRSAIIGWGVNQKRLAPNTSS